MEAETVPGPELVADGPELHEVALFGLRGDCGDYELEARRPGHPDVVNEGRPGCWTASGCSLGACGVRRHVVSGGGCKTTRVGRSDFTAVFLWLEPHPVRGRRAVAARVRRAPATRPSGRHDRDAPTRA